MKNFIIPLNILPVGKSAIVRELVSDGNSRRRMLDLGLVENTIVKCLQESPSKDPVAYYIRGTVIALRKQEASKILVEALD